MADGDWKLAGNAATNPPVDFLGTVDGEPLVFKTNGNEAVRVDASGSVGIGLSAPKAKFHVQSKEGFERPQIALTQPTPQEYARIRLQSTGRDADGAIVPYALWDIAAGVGKLNVFVLGAGNVMTFTQQGNVGVGTDRPGAKLDVNGTARVNVLEVTGGADLAEAFSLADDEDVEAVDPGTVMVIDDRRPGMIRASETPCDRKVAGVLSGAGELASGVTFGATWPGTGTGHRLALTGRVHCKAEADSHPIEPGDLLVTSAVRGHAMRAEQGADCHGAVLGKAMSGLGGGTGLVLALVNLL
ncbi:MULTISPECIES: hypothetical protein [Streptomyces]|uniref:Uncharacterized protein n=1 Tax=Streptomyces luteosporeus TaxID=173856 RepID=A0ABN3TR48_9ACTN